MAKFWSGQTRLYYGGYDLGTATTQIQLGRMQVALDTTALNDAAERTVAGLRQDTVTWAGIFDDATSHDAAMAILLGSSPGSNMVLTLHVGTTTGDVAYAGTAMPLRHGVPVAHDELVRAEMDFVNDDTWQRGVGWVRTTLTGTGATNSAGSVDNSAASTGSGTFYMQVFDTSGGTGSVSFQDSADAVTWANLVSVAVATGGTAIVRSIGSGAGGTVRRYTRIVEDMAS